MFVVGELLRDLPPEDRIAPIDVGMLPRRQWRRRAAICASRWRTLAESKELVKFCRRFTVPLRAGAARKAGVLTRYETPAASGWL